MVNLIIEKTEQYIYDNIDENISIKDICKHLNISSTSLTQYFNKELNITPHRFILSIKILKAKELLIKGDNISEIAQDIGFCDQSHLNRVFKKYEGITPYGYKMKNCEI